VRHGDESGREAPRIANPGRKAILRIGKSLKVRRHGELDDPVEVNVVESTASRQPGSGIFGRALLGAIAAHREAGASAE